MNRTKIEWADYTWSPVTGCYHGCKYCYARRIAHRFRNQDKESVETAEWMKKNRMVLESQSKDPYPCNFVPTFHKNRLDQPAKRKKPAKIFVSSMGDLFGEWVPDEWIEEVLKVVRDCPQHTFMFLTKNPNRYYKWFGYDIENIPMNVWIGSSADNATDAHVRSENLGFMDAKVKFLSLEPLLEDVSEYIEWEAFDWLIIGGQTGPGAKETIPAWVENAISYARAYDLPIFLKDNLEWPEKVQEWPEVMK